MNTIKLAVNGPMTDPDLGPVYTVDVLRFYDGDAGVSKSWFVKASDICEAVKMASENIESYTNEARNPS